MNRTVYYNDKINEWNRIESMDTRYFILAVLMTFFQLLFGQNNRKDYIFERGSKEEPAPVTLSILDTCVHYNPRFDAVRIAVVLNNQSDRSLFFVDFKRHIPVDPFSCDEFTVSDYKNGRKNNGLVYFVEDGKGEIVQCDKVHVTPIDENLERRKYHILDENSLKYQDSFFPMEENPYEEVSRGERSFESFLLIKHNYSLSPSRYKVFLAYFFTGETKLNIWNSRVFRGSLISNKVDLIVENHRHKWWKRWKREAK